MGDIIFTVMLQLPHFSFYRLGTCFLLMITHWQLLCQSQADCLHALRRGSVEVPGQEQLACLEKLSWDLRRAENDRAEEYALSGIRMAGLAGDSMALFRINAHLALIKAYQGEFQNAVGLLKQSAAYFQTKGAAYELARTNFIGGSIQASHGQRELSDSLLLQAIATFTELRDSTFLPQCLSLRGNNLWAKGAHEQAYEYFARALDLCDGPGRTQFRSFILLQLAAVELEQGNYAGALQHYFELLESEPEDFSRVKALTKISFVYRLLKDWESALQYQAEALKLTQGLQIEFETALCLQALGEIEQERHNYGEALKHYEKALALEDGLREERPWLFGNTLLSLGEVQQILGNSHQALGFLERAITYFQQLVNTFSTNSANATDRGYQSSICKAHYQMAQVYLQSGKNNSALEFALQSLGIAEKLQHATLLENCHRLLYEVYQAKGEEEPSHAHQLAYLSIKDSLLSIENYREIAALERRMALGEEKPAEPSGFRLRHSPFWLLMTVAILVMGMLLWRSRRRLVLSSNRAERSSLDKKLDHYFTELFRRMDQEGTVAEGPAKVKNLAGFLLDNVQSTQDWQAFLHYFQQVHPNFFKDLKTQYPKITANELNLCALLKLNISNKEIAQILGISPDSVRKAQHRLRQKIELADNQSVRDFILQK